jgi:hypothetical protein
MEEPKKETEDMKWWEKKWKTAPANLNEAELLRLAEEQKQERLAREKELRETQLATEKRNAEFWRDIEKSCKDGTPEERFAVCLIRMSAQNLLVTTYMPLQEKQRRIVQMLRLHGVKITDSKEKIPLTSYMGASDLFSSDVFVRKGDIVQTRRSMFPENKTETTVGGEQ